MNLRISLVVSVLVLVTFSSCKNNENPFSLNKNPLNESNTSSSSLIYPLDILLGTPAFAAMKIDPAPNGMEAYVIGDPTQGDQLKVYYPELGKFVIYVKTNVMSPIPLSASIPCGTFSNPCIQNIQTKFYYQSDYSIKKAPLFFTNTTCAANNNSEVYMYIEGMDVSPHSIYLGSDNNFYTINSTQGIEFKEAGIQSKLTYEQFPAEGLSSDGASKQLNQQNGPCYRPLDKFSAETYFQEVYIPQPDQTTVARKMAYFIKMKLFQQGIQLFLPLYLKI